MKYVLQSVQTFTKKGSDVSMNSFKRAITNIKRQPVKNGVLLFLILILAAALSGAISTRQAINNTEESMMLRMPAVATFSLNVEAVVEETGISQMQLGPEFWRTNRPTIEDISAVGSLPYVRMYDAIMLPTLFSQDLEWVVKEIASTVTGMRSMGGYIEMFEGRGVANPDVTDIDAGLIELVAGRTFTQDEINNGEQVVIIPQSLAEINNLYIGATIEFENIVHNTPKMVREGISFLVPYWHEERFMAAHQILEFEVIGIFDTPNEFNYQVHDAWGIEEYARLHNRIYMPILVAEDILIFENEGRLLIIDEILELFGGHTSEWVHEEPWVQSIFILYDPRDLDAFQDAGSELLPGFWEINSLLDVNASLISSMDTMGGIADFILLATACATIAVLTLVITLLLRDRRHEIGVYMALGEKKGRIIFQFLTEIILVSTVAIMIALFIGNGISTALSRNLLEQYLIENTQQATIQFGDGALPPELMLFNPGELSIEATLEMYDTSLDMATIAIFIGVGAVVILLSTAIPIVYVVKLEPKKVLLS